MVAIDVSQPASTALPHVPLPEVSWQTLFWIITTLAINSMTQPCGWVCGFNSRYKPYIRSSPAICVVDIIFMLCRWIGAFVKPGPSHLNVRESFYKIIIDRFRGNDPPGGIRTIGNSTGIRWFLFVMGPLPQAIRLASFRGVYWSKAIGFSFLGPWLVMEIVLLARALSRRHLESLETLYGASRQEIDNVMHDSHLIEPFLCIYMSHVSISVLIVYGVKAENYFWPFEDSAEILAENLGVLAAVTLCVLVTFFRIVVAGTSFVLLQKALTKIPWLGQNMLVPHFVQRHQAVEVDTWAVGFFASFLINFLLLARGYSFFYDQSGTVNPGWTGVFG